MIEIVSANRDSFSLGSAVLPVYLPAVLFSLGEGAIIPIIPSIAARLGADLALAGLIAALLMLGSLLGNLPAGLLVARFGERNSMIGSAIIAGIGATIAVFSEHLLMFALAILVIGLGHSVFTLARHSFMTTFVPITHRARALSTLGGAFRAGIFVGPFITAGIVYFFVESRYVFFAMIFFCLLIVLVLWVIEDPTEKLIQARLASTASIPVLTGKQDSIWQVISKFRKPLLRLGIPSAILSGLRTSRQVLFPLWAVSIGMGEAETAIVIGIAGAVDFSLFYLGGIVMDRFGRMFTTVPSLIALSIGFVILSFTHDLASTEYWFFWLAIFLSIANGVSAGVLMTLGSDLAPKYNPAPFLGAWKVSTDLGQALTPLLIAGITGLVSITVASGVVGAIGFLGAYLYFRYIPRYDPLHEVRAEERYQRKIHRRELRDQVRSKKRQNKALRNNKTVN